MQIVTNNESVAGVRGHLGARGHCATPLKTGLFLEYVERVKRKLYYKSLLTLTS